MYEICKIDIKYWNLGTFLNKNDIRNIENFYRIDDKIFQQEVLLFAPIIKSNSALKFRKIIKLLCTSMQNLSIDYTPFPEITNIEDLLHKLLSFFILKALNSQNVGAVSDKKTLRGHSDTVINQCVLFLEKFIFMLNIKTFPKITITPRESRLMFYILIKTLVVEGKIGEKVIRNGEKTFIMYVHDFVFENETPVFFFQRFNIWTNGNIRYIYSNHYSSFFKIFKENPRSGDSFKANDISSLDKLLTKGYFLDKDMLKNIIDIELEAHGIKKETISQMYKDLLKEQIRLLHQCNIIAASKLSEKISLYGSLIRQLQILNIETNECKIYLPFMFDFRGRLYYLSSASPTFYKEFRYCLWEGMYENLSTKTHYTNATIEKELDKTIHFIDNWTTFNFKNKKLSVKRGVIWILISIAEPFKTTLGKTVTFAQFVKKGIELTETYEKRSKTYELSDRIKLFYLIKLLNEISRGEYKKRFIFKDATASVFQHMVKALNANNSDSIKYCNLSSIDTWYDTYSHIIENILSSQKLTYLTNEEFKYIFSRKHMKKLIMTENYGAGFKRCWFEFKDSLKLEDLGELKTKEIWKILENFYNALSKNNTITLYPSDKIDDFFMKNENPEISLYDNSKIRIGYYKTEIRQIEIRYKNIRHSKKELFMSTEPDREKTKIAVKANYIQSMDAALVWWYIKEDAGITIHDSFMSDWINVTYLISKINEGMRIKFHDLGLEKKIETSKLFSPFILL